MVENTIFFILSIFLFSYFSIIQSNKTLKENLLKDMYEMEQIQNDIYLLLFIIHIKTH